MRSQLYCLTILALFSEARAQNLAPNYSFEQIQNCPSALSQVTTHCTTWYQYTDGTPDLFNSCSIPNTFSVPKNMFGSQPAIGNGKGYVGMYTYFNNGNYKEYVAAPLVSPLKPGCHYAVSISVCLAERAYYATDGLGVYFFNSPASVATQATLTVTPQISYLPYGPISDTSGWTRLEDTFQAVAAYTHMVIGGFADDAGITNIPTGFANPILFTSYYYVDSVVVVALDTLSFDFSGKFCAGDSVTVPFTAQPYFGAGNVFTLQLSDAGGSFANAVNIGTAPGTATVVSGMIPPGTAPGNSYRVRITANNPGFISAPNTTGIEITEGIKLTATANTPLCSGDTLRLTVITAASQAEWLWTGPDNFTSALQNPVINNVLPGMQGAYVVAASLGGCHSLDTVNIVIHETPGITASGNSPVCEGDSLLLTAYSATPGTSYRWTGPRFESEEPDPVRPGATDEYEGIYEVMATANGCTAATRIPVQIIDTPSVNLGADVHLCRGTMITIGTEKEDAAYSWNTGSAECCLPVNQQGLYAQTITNQCGAATDSIFIYMSPCDSCLFIPSAFTPNGDGRNDMAGVISRCPLKNFTLRIFNRWGMQVFYTTDANTKWDGSLRGEPAEVGMYFYLAEYTPDTLFSGSEKMIAKGEILLIR